jgi:hypothetical protein
MQNSPVTTTELDAALTRWFLTAGLGAADRARLIDAAVAYVADPARTGGQVGLFAPDDPIGHGLAWWEERQGGAGHTVLPISAIDHALMLWTSEPRLDPRPAPRPHVPRELCGGWRSSEPPRSWILDASGALRGDPARDGWGWRVHEGMIRSLCLGPDYDPLRERWTILDLGADELEVIPPDVIVGSVRYARFE